MNSMTIEEFIERAGMPYSGGEVYIHKIEPCIRCGRKAVEFSIGTIGIGDRGGHDDLSELGSGATLAEALADAERNMDAANWPKPGQAD